MQVHYFKSKNEEFTFFELTKFHLYIDGCIAPLSGDGREAGSLQMELSHGKNFTERANSLQSVNCMKVQVLKWRY